jgi:hypothetical protein
VAAVLLHIYPIVLPQLLSDDFRIIAGSLTWRAAWNNLWVPHNEHVMPLGRLSTALLVQLAGTLPNLPILAALQGPVALLLAMLLLYVFVKRELGHSVYGLMALVIFGVSSVYHQAVFWFAASFALLMFDTFLLALLAAQAWRQRRVRWGLAGALLGCALAPAWFAGGVLAGPLCSIYLLASQANRKGFLAALVPLLGTALFLAVSLPRTHEHIMYLEHYGDQTALEAFDPLVGLQYTARSLVDNLFLGAFGISHVSCPVVLVPVVLFAIVIGLFRWWQPVQKRTLLYLGIGLILLSYWLIYSARSGWDYDRVGMNGSVWLRYHLLPQMGLALLICGGLPPRIGSRLLPDGLSADQARALSWLIGILFVMQLPRGLLSSVRHDPSQHEVLQQIEAMDLRCRLQRVSAEAAIDVLEPLRVPLGDDADNGWALLRGSPEPQDLSFDEARRRLTERSN